MRADWFLLVVLSLASYRAWRLIGADAITESLRDWLFGEYDERTDKHIAHPWLGKMTTCPWCSGSWLSFAVVGVVDAWLVPLPLPVLWAGAVACLVGLIGVYDH